MRLMTRWSILLAVLTASIAFVPGTATADDEDYAAPVYLIVSFDDDFVQAGAGGEEDPPASQTILVNIGTLTGGGDILDTRFAANAALSFALPEGYDGEGFAAFQNNASTVLGSFKTTDFSEIHMVTPSAEGIDADIQVAVFNATRLGKLDTLLIDSPFPTTTQIAEAIWEELRDPEAYTVAQVAAAVFGAVVPLSVIEPADGEQPALAAGEGEMFPHSLGAASLFRYKVQFSENGDFESDVCLLVGIDIKPDSDSNPININKQGSLPVAILTTDSFDATDVDGDTATIGGVLADKWAIEDVDGDGDDDMILHWSVPDLVDAGAIEEDTTELTVRADLEDGSCVTGTDNVTIKTK